jgi:hypothetical protein
LKISKGGNQNPYIEEEPTTQWPKKKDKQRSTKHTHKTKDLVTRTPLRIGDELMFDVMFNTVITSKSTEYCSPNWKKIVNKSVCIIILTCLVSSNPYISYSLEERVYTH